MFPLILQAPSSQPQGHGDIVSPGTDTRPVPLRHSLLGVPHPHPGCNGVRPGLALPTPGCLHRGDMPGMVSPEVVPFEDALRTGQAMAGVAEGREGKGRGGPTAQHGRARALAKSRQLCSRCRLPFFH